MSREVNANVVLSDPVTGDRVVLLAGDTPSKDIAAVLGDHLFGEPVGDEPPPRSGQGSGVKAWAAYASAQGVQVPEDASRDEIVDALRDAGKPVGD